MTEINLLEQLLALDKYGTLSLAAEKTHISQPSLSRGMKKLEDEMGAPLFERSKNRISLNENGLLAAQYARQIIDRCNEMTASVRALNKSRNTISIGSVAPGPLFTLSPLISSLYTDKTVITEFGSENELLSRLSKGLYGIIVLNRKYESEDTSFHYAGSERLYASLPKTHPLAGRSEISFAEMDGEDFLMASEVGFWDRIVRKEMPDSSFHLQSDMASLRAVIASSSMPSFATDVTLRLARQERDRAYVPFKDESAKTSYYCLCKKSEEMKYLILFQEMERRAKDFL